MFNDEGHSTGLNIKTPYVLMSVGSKRRKLCHITVCAWSFYAIIVFTAVTNDRYKLTVQSIGQNEIFPSHVYPFLGIQYISDQTLL